MKKKKQNNKISNIISYSFIFIFLLSLIGCSFYALRETKDINEYENRTANKFETLNTKTFLEGTFQSSIDETLSDQLPLALTIKKVYNFGNSLLTKNVTDLFIGKYCNNNYIRYNGVLAYGCEDNLVYSKMMYKDNYKGFENRIANINDVIKNSKAQVYIYYIERDSDIDFTDNSKSDMAKKLKEKINTDNFYIYEINNFKEFKENFYKTDHHWNHKGSYLAYTNWHDILEIEEEPLKPLGETCRKEKWAGSKASMSGSQYIYGENLCSYNYDFKDYDVYVNGTKDIMGHDNINDITAVTYAGLYGWDAGEVILDFHNEDKENILFIGESYDNAIIKLIGSHYNKLYAVDLRHYTDENNKTFKLNEYIKENNIDKVVLIGNYGYYMDATFNIEV